MDKFARNNLLKEICRRKFARRNLLEEICKRKLAAKNLLDKAIWVYKVSAIKSV